MALLLGVVLVLRLRGLRLLRLVPVAVAIAVRALSGVGVERVGDPTVADLLAVQPEPRFRCGSLHDVVERGRLPAVAGGVGGSPFVVGGGGPPAPFYFVEDRPGVGPARKWEAPHLPL